MVLSCFYVTIKCAEMQRKIGLKKENMELKQTLNKSLICVGFGLSAFCLLHGAVHADNVNESADVKLEVAKVNQNAEKQDKAAVPVIEHHDSQVANDSKQTAVLDNNAKSDATANKQTAVLDNNAKSDATANKQIADNVNETAKTDESTNANSVKEDAVQADTVESSVKKHVSDFTQKVNDDVTNDDSATNTFNVKTSGDSLDPSMFDVSLRKKRPSHRTSHRTSHRSSTHRTSHTTHKSHSETSSGKVSHYTRPDGTEVTVTRHNGHSYENWVDKNGNMMSTSHASGIQLNGTHSETNVYRYADGAVVRNDNWDGSKPDGWAGFVDKNGVPQGSADHHPIIDSSGQPWHYDPVAGHYQKDDPTGSTYVNQNTDPTPDYTPSYDPDPDPDYTPDPGDSGTPYVPTPVTATNNITFVDDDENNKQVASYSISGEVGTSQSVKTNISNNYVLNGNANGWNAANNTFTGTVQSSGSYLIHLKHRLTEIDPHQYKDYNSYSHRTLTIDEPNGKHNVISQQIHFVRRGQLDHVLNKVVNLTNWSFDTKDANNTDAYIINGKVFFKQIYTPKISGYKPVPIIGSNQKYSLAYVPTNNIKLRPTLNLHKHLSNFDLHLKHHISNFN